MIRFLLPVIVFISGAVLMGLEIVGSRILAPYFGNSIFVWGSLISVVLAALSLGYYLGGRFSAHNPSFLRLLGLLVIPGILLFFLPFIYPGVNHWIATVDFGVRLNPLMACTAYFLPPSIFLGAVSPYAIRLSATTLSTVGTTAGSLYAISTCGSIFGTLFTAFYLIPLIGVRNIVHSLGVTLMLLYALSWLLSRLHRSRAGLSLILISLLMPLPAAGKVLYQKDSFYHGILVEEDDVARYLYFDRTLQSSMSLDDPTSLMLQYSRFASLGLTLRPEARKMLIIGLGGGSMAKKYIKEFPYMEIDVAEIDPEVVKVAKRYFSFLEGGNVRVEARGRPPLSDAHSPALRRYFPRRLLFRLHTLPSDHAGVFSDGGAQAHAPWRPRGQHHRGRQRSPEQSRPLGPQDHKRSLPPDLRLSHPRGRRRQLRHGPERHLPRQQGSRRITIQEIVKRATSLGRDLFPDPPRSIADAYYDNAIPTNDVPLLTDNYAPTDSLLRY